MTGGHSVADMVPDSGFRGELLAMRGLLQCSDKGASITTSSNPFCPYMCILKKPQIPRLITKAPILNQVRLLVTHIL